MDHLVLFLTFLSLNVLPGNTLCDGWTCRNGECLDRLYTDYCDGYVDCDDGSDEYGCLTCYHGFLCDDGYCTYSVSDRCNGVSDCSDGSDERNCHVEDECDEEEESDDDGNCAGSIGHGGPHGHFGRGIGLIIGFSVAGFVLLVALPTIFCVVLLCCVFGCAGVARSTEASSSSGRRTWKNNTVTQEPAQQATTTQQPVHPMEPPPQTPPPPYNENFEKAAWHQQQGGNQTQEVVVAVYPPSGHPPPPHDQGVYPSRDQSQPAYMYPQDKYNVM